MEGGVRKRGGGGRVRNGTPLARKAVAERSEGAPEGCLCNSATWQHG